MVLTKLSMDCGIPHICQQTLNFMFWEGMSLVRREDLEDVILPVEACLSLQVLGRKIWSRWRLLFGVKSEVVLIMLSVSTPTDTVKLVF